MHTQNENKLSKELAPIKSSKNKFTLTKSPISKEQILSIFQRTPDKHKHKRPGKGGGEWDYVTGVYVKKVLNYVFGWLWDFEIVDKGDVEAGGKKLQVWVQGKLTIRHPESLNPIIIKTQFGGADVKYMKSNPNRVLDYANDLKAASTDALKKCASELGIASDIYGKNEFKEINNGGEKKTAPGRKPQPTPAVDYLKKLEDELEKRGAKTWREAVPLYNKITGENIKSLNVAQSTAQKYLFNLLNAPMGK